MKPRADFPDWLCITQGGYYFGRGIWPLVSIDTFQPVTGPKTDVWLVQTLGILLAVIGATLLLALRRPDAKWFAGVLAIGSATGLFFIDFLYTFRRVISPVYLGDAAIQFVLIVAWLLALKRR